MRFSPVALSYACQECAERFATSQGLRNHQNRHRLDRIRKERVQPLPVPRTRQGIRRLRGQPEPEQDVVPAEMAPSVRDDRPTTPVARPVSQGRAMQLDIATVDIADESDDGTHPETPAAEQTAIAVPPPTTSPPPPAGTAAPPIPSPPPSSDDEGAAPPNAPVQHPARSRGPSHQSLPDDESRGPLGAFVPRLEDLLGEAVDETTWATFCAVLEELMEEAARIVKLRPPRDHQDVASRRQPDPNDASTIQRMYRTNRRRAIRLLAGDNSPRCRIGREEITRHFTDVWSPRDHDPTVYPANPHPGRPQLDVERFRREEVEVRLRRAENTAPGPDRITYAMWRRADPEGHALTAVYDVCLKHRRIPGSWRSTRTVLIHKKGSVDVVTNWRPITLSNTIYKLYAGCLAARLTSWLTEHQVLHPAQKGFMPHDGVFEHNYVLQCAVNEARRGRRQLCVAWLDVSNAFGSVPHGAIVDAVRGAGVGAAFTQIVRDIVGGASSEVLTREGPTPAIPVGAGVKQGCPLSGLLFNLALDPIIRGVQGTHDDHRVLAFADDLVVLAEDPEDLQLQLNHVEETARRIALRMNPGKSRSVHVRTHPLGVHDTVFKIAGQDIPRFAGVDDYEKFLGTPVGFSVIPSNATLVDITALGLKVLRSKLAPWQRLDALRTFVASSASFHMRSGVFQKTQWSEVDRVFRPEIKRTLNVPQEAANEYLYGSSRSGLCGVPLLAESSDLALVDSAFKLLTSRDRLLCAMTSAHLRSIVRRRIITDPTADLMSRYMSGDNGHPFGGTTDELCTIWSRARAASRRLDVAWRFDGNEPNLQSGATNISPQNRRRVMAMIRQGCNANRLRRLIALRSQGKAIECVASDPVSNHFLRDGAFTRFADWRFVHRARLNLVPLRANMRRGGPGQQDLDRGCRRCGAQLETLPHVMCHCLAASAPRLRRHDAILDRIEKAARARFQVLSRGSIIPGTRLKPDLVLARGRRLHVLDVTCPFEDRLDAFRAARERKVAKYHPLIAHFRDRYDEVTIEPIVVGTLGTWDKRNDAFLRKICSRSYLRLMRRLVVSDTIRWSRDIIVEHITGHRQYRAGSDDILSEDGLV